MVTTPIQEVEYATLELEAVLWIPNFLPLRIWIRIIIPDPDPGRLLLEQAHHVVVTPSQEVEYATLELETD